jgi:uncharacterized damage-inducible protein DinB
MNAPQFLRRDFLKRASAGTAALAGLPLLRTAPPAPFDPSWFSEVWQRARTYTLAMAETMPENKYTYRPAADTRTFAEQLLHLAGANLFFAGQVGATPPPSPDLNAEGKSKEQVIQLLTESFDYVSTTLASLNLEQSEERVQVVGQSLTKWEVLLLTRDHATHHRGQLVVYLRMNRIEPPQYVGF